MASRAGALLVVVALLGSSLFAWADDPVIRVSLHIQPPFVEAIGANEFAGFSVELWRAIAQSRHWQSEFVVAPDVQKQLEAVALHAADIGVGAISITAERDLLFDFSQPLLNAGLQILVRSERASPESTALENLLHLLFSPSILVWLGIAGLLTIIPAHLVWWYERRHPEGMVVSKNYFPGIFQVFFWGLGTLATQADSMPRHWISRIVAVLWMFTSVVFVAFYTAQLTATLTAQQFKSEINGPEDLPGKKIATIAGTTSADYVRSNGIESALYSSADDAARALLNKEVDAVVFDAPILQYLAAHKLNGRVNVVGPVFHSEDYGFAFSPDSALRKQVDNALLVMRENGAYDRLVEKWFGRR